MHESDFVKKNTNTQKGKSLLKTTCWPRIAKCASEDALRQNHLGHLFKCISLEAKIGSYHSSAKHHSVVAHSIRKKSTFQSHAPHHRHGTRPCPSPPSDLKGWCSLIHSLPPSRFLVVLAHKRVFAQALSSASSLSLQLTGSSDLSESLKNHLCPHQQLQSRTACFHLLYLILHLNYQPLDLTYLRCASPLLPAHSDTHRHLCLTQSFTQAVTPLSYSETIVNKMQLTRHHLRPMPFLSRSRSLET